MPWIRQLRSSASLYGFIVVLPLVFWQVESQQLNYVNGYWSTSISKASHLLFLIAPICAACGAWEGHRAKTAKVHEGAPARSALRIAVNSLLPVFAVGVAGMVLAVVLLLPGSQFPFLSTITLLPAMWLVSILGYSFAGYVLGISLPNALALPLAIAVSYVVMAYPPAMEPFWLRHLTGGGINNCCTVNQTLDLRAITTPMLVLGTVVLACLLLIHLGRRLLTLVVALALISGGILGGVLMVRSMTAIPAVDRSDSRCEGNAPQLCLWPEQEVKRQEILESATSAYRALQAAGLHPATTLSTSGSPSPSIRLSMDDRTPAGEMPLTIATGMLTHNLPECVKNGSYPGGEAYKPLQAWLSLTGGMSTQELSHAGMAPDALALADSVRKLPVQDQLRWYTYNLASTHNCSTVPLLEAKAPSTAQTKAAQTKAARTKAVQAKEVQ
ncbi:hypothetical protein ACFY12_17485 [Streptomyces sp. NPDC001339]|uniref:DUF7224 domain-containing protein n=1 Tax=Streptomyces sp. NPDC001339 TaxID=3364563 RepID=UPI0036D17783